MKYLILTLALFVSSNSFAGIKEYKKSLTHYVELCNAPSSVVVSSRPSNDLINLNALEQETVDHLLLILNDDARQNPVKLTGFEYNLDNLNVDRNSACTIGLEELKKNTSLVVAATGLNTFNVAMTQYYFVVSVDQKDFVISLSLINL